MGRKAGVSPAETRQAVLDAALGTFARMGYHGASTRSISAAADLTIGAVHHHFGSKSELYVACIEEADKRLGSLIQDAMKEFPKGGLSASARVAVRTLRDERLSLAIRLVARKIWEDPEGAVAERLDSHGTALDQGARVVAQARQIPLLQARVRTQAAIFVLARFALSPAKERAFLTETDDETKALELLEEELVNTLVHIVAN